MMVAAIAEKETKEGGRSLPVMVIADKITMNRCSEIHVRNCSKAQKNMKLRLQAVHIRLRSEVRKLCKHFEGINGYSFHFHFHTALSSPIFAGVNQRINNNNERTRQ